MLSVRLVPKHIRPRSLQKLVWQRHAILAQGINNYFSRLKVGPMYQIFPLKSTKSCIYSLRIGIFFHTLVQRRAMIYDIFWLNLNCMVTTLGNEYKIIASTLCWYWSHGKRVQLLWPHNECVCWVESVANIKESLIARYLTIL